MNLKWPSGKELGGPPGAVGRQITSDNARAGHVDNGLLAYEERLNVCRKYWPEGRRQDFEKLDGRGRRWLDRATNIVYRRIGGCGPLLNPTLEAVDCWFLEEGEIVLVVRDDRVETSTVVHGPIRGGVVVDGRIVWEGSA